MSMESMPTSKKLQEAVLQALKFHGGQASNAQIYVWVVKNLAISEEQIKVVRSGNRTEIEYRLAWARTRAQKHGEIKRSGSATWSLL